MISRRSLFALFGGAAVAPLAKVLPAEANPPPEIISRTWQWREIPLPKRVVFVAYGGGGAGPYPGLVCENHHDKAWPDECDCGPGMRA